MTKTKTRAKVSIIIPAFNEEKFLPLCLQAIAMVDWPKEQLEVIVVDNGSIDRTIQIAESFNAVVLQNHEKNVSGLRNLGAQHATGDILAFVDADCIVSEDWLICSEPYFDQKDLAAWGGPPDIPEQSTWVQKAWFLVRQKQEKIQAVEWLESMNLFVRKAIFLKVFGFDEALVTCEDVDFSYRISKFGRIIADQSIHVRHLGEADTLRTFIKKEFWRGRGNYKGVFNHGLNLKEIPSLAMPIYFGLFFPAIALTAFFYFSIISASILALTAIFPGMVTLYKVRKKEPGLMIRMQLLVIVYIYFIVRTLAVFPFNRD